MYKNLINLITWLKNEITILKLQDNIDKIKFDCDQSVCKKAHNAFITSSCVLIYVLNCKILKYKNMYNWPKHLCLKKVFQNNSQQPYLISVECKLKF